MSDPKDSTGSADSPETFAATAPTAIVFEKKPRWAPELQRQFSTEKVRVVACRSVRDVEERSAGVSCGAVLLDASVATADCLQFLRRGLSDPTALPVVIVGSERVADLEWLFLELGAVMFFSKQTPGHEMASLCRRQWSVRGPSRLERPAASHHIQRSNLS